MVKRTQAIGATQPFVDILPMPFKAQRSPTTNDTNWEAGQIWLDDSQSPADLYIYQGGGNWQLNNLTLSTDGTFAAPSNSTASSSLAIKTYVDATASFGAPIASDSAQGIAWTASNAQCIAGTANDATNAYMVSPDNLATIFGSPNAAIGGTTPVAGTFKALTADGTGAVSLTGNAASTLTNTSGDLTVDAQAGSLVLDSGEATADAIRIVASNAAGGFDCDSGTGGMAFDSTGAISLDGAAASNFTTSSGDLTLAASAGSVNVNAGENAAQAIYLHANGGVNETIQLHADQGTATTSVYLLSDVGGITLTATGSTDTNAIDINAVAGGFDLDAAGQVNIASSQNAASSIVITSSAGGIDITATASGGAGEDIDIVCTGGSVNISGTENVADAVTIAAANGGIDITCGGAAGEDIDIVNTAGSININAGEAIADAMVLTSAGGLDFVVTGAAGRDIDMTCTSGSINVTAGESAADAFVLNASGAAGGVQIQAGTGGVLIGNQADCTTLALGDFAPTASRTTTIGGGTVITAAVTDLVDIAPDGATTNADSIKRVDINTGTVAVGQSLTNIATGTITSGTHTVSIQSGNAAAGTVACNISTGTGTKSVNVGNADGLTTTAILGPVNVNVNQNNNVAINTGTSTGTVTIGNGAAGAIAVDSGAGISLDAATASNFACAAGDMTIDAAAGSLILHAGENAADSIQITTDTGGIDITCSGAGAGDDIDITNTGGSINITATENASDAFVLNCSGAASGISIDCGTAGVTLGTGIIRPVTARATAGGTYTCLGTDYLIATDSTGGGFQINLPAAPETGREYIVYDAAGQAAIGGNVTVSGNGNNIAAGGASAATFVLNTAYESLRVIYDGTLWLGQNIV